MTVDDTETLKANLVLVGLRLIRTPEEKAVFEGRVGAEVTESTPLGIAVSIQSGSDDIDLMPKALVLGRDRITLDTTPDRTVISMDYPSREDDLRRLAEVAWIAIDSTTSAGNQGLRAFGFNVEVVRELPEGVLAGLFISNRIYKSGLLGDSGFEIIGGTPKLQLWKENRQWNLGIEPRFGNPASNKIFLTVNLHFDEVAQLSSQSAIEESLVLAWDQALAIAGGL